MRKILYIFITVIFLVGSIRAGSFEERIKNISKIEMQSVLEFLSHDLLEGRKYGARGGNISEIYIKSLFKWMNLKPESNREYMQPFVLKGFTLEELQVQVNQSHLKFGEDIVGGWVGEKSEFDFEGEVVFVGFGITTNIWDWDDYKGYDVKGKVLITRVNHPGLYNDKIFGGKQINYFYWDHHIDEAARRGAVAIIFIHSMETAWYDWELYKNYGHREWVFLKEDVQNSLKFRGWIKEDSLKKILKDKKINLEKLYKKSKTRRFKPVPLDLKFHIKGKCKHRDILNHNVVAEIPGKSKKKIVLSSHIDHLGILSQKKEDVIYNGAIDNSSAVAAMMITAKILKEFQDTLYYSVLVVATNAEEAWMLGARHYLMKNPNRRNFIANLNFESTPVWGKTSDFLAVGGQFSTLEDMLIPILKEKNLVYDNSFGTKEGLFYRGDQIAFARFNIPGIWISAGENDDSGEKKYQTHWKKYYHTVDDEYDPNWPLEGLRQTIQISLLLIDHMNKTQSIPKWKVKLPFPVEN